jgi:hypothetical protein
MAINFGPSSGNVYKKPIMILTTRFKVVSHVESWEHMRDRFSDDMGKTLAKRLREQFVRDIGHALSQRHFEIPPHLIEADLDHRTSEMHGSVEFELAITVGKRSDP